MLTQNLGYPRIGTNRELKKACENYWSGKCDKKELFETGKTLRKQNWNLQHKAGVSLIPSNDFSYYDHVLDTTLLLGAIPDRYRPLMSSMQTQDGSLIDVYFAMARGYQKNQWDIPAMEMTKWFDTNYHYIVPEFTKNQNFSLLSSKIFDEFEEARKEGILTKPVLLGPVSYLLLGKEKEEGFHRLDLLKNVLPVYLEILQKLELAGAEWIQIDEPFLVTDLDTRSREAYRIAYEEMSSVLQQLKIMLVTYFEGLRDNLSLAMDLPVHGLHVDLVRCPDQFYDVVNALPSGRWLSLGIVDGRNIWKNNLKNSLDLIGKAVSKIGRDRIIIAPSCSLMHVPCDLELEDDSSPLPKEVKQWLSFAKQKIEEICLLEKLSSADQPNDEHLRLLKFNQAALEDRRNCSKVHDEKVKKRVRDLDHILPERTSPYPERRKKQKNSLNLPYFPTTTIGSFPQTSEVRKHRARYKKGDLSKDQYENLIREEIRSAIAWQEKIGLDVLVHGEFERNDMVEYFGEQLQGFAFTKNGWVQSYGSRCVKPPIIYGDVLRTKPMTVEWIKFAQEQTSHLVKGILTGPVTILLWSFVRDDQPRSETAMQIALAINDEVRDLENAGVKIIQIDEPAIREGLPIRKSDRPAYLDWAVKAFRVSFLGVKDETQIHTHMCYSEFNDMIESIAAMDADVISIETSRSQMELLNAFVNFKYPNEIGPGVYDIHSPRVPDKKEMIDLLEKAAAVIDPEKLWVNPDCGLKTRNWPETEAALKEMVEAAREMRKRIKVVS